MVASNMKWNHAGSVLAVAGTPKTSRKDDKEGNAVQFYTPFGRVCNNNIFLIDCSTCEH